METLDWHGAKPPRREALEGESVRLEPLDAQRHGDDLFAAAAGADETWRYLPYGPFAGKDEFIPWLDERAAMADPLAFLPRAPGNNTADAGDPAQQRAGLAAVALPQASGLTRPLDRPIEA